MNSFFANILKSIREFFASKTPKQKAWMAVGAGVFITLMVIVTILISQVEYAVLYSGLSPENAGIINSALDDMSVQHRTEGILTMTISVPKDRVSELRSTLAAQGYTPTNGFDYSMFDNISSFGTTDAEQQMTAVFMRQEMIKKQILQLDKVSECTVLLTIPTTSPYALQKNQQQPSATVVITTRNDEPLTTAEANTIFDMVVNGVGGTINYERITIADKHANSYTFSDNTNITADTEVAERLMLENSARRTTEEQVQSLLTPAFGYGHVKSVVHLKLNFDEVRSEEIVFAPPVEGEVQGMILSMSELYELSRYGYAEAEGIPGTDSNGMGVAEYPYDGELDESELFEKVVREINYEMNKTTTQIVQAKGSISELSIGVLIDASVIDPGNYTNITNAVRRLVANAIGTKESLVSVELLPFQEIDDTITQALSSQQEFEDMMRTRELIRTAIICFTILILALLIILFLRSLLKKREAVLAPEHAGAEPGEYDEFEYGENLDILAGGGDDESLLAAIADQDIEDSEMIEKPKNYLAELQNLIENDPRSVAQLLRNWLVD